MQSAPVLAGGVVAPLSICVIDGHRHQGDRGNGADLSVRQLGDSADSLDDAVDGGIVQRRTWGSSNTTVKVGHGVCGLRPGRGNCLTASATPPTGGV